MRTKMIQIEGADYLLSEDAALCASPIACAVADTWVDARMKARCAAMFELNPEGANTLDRFETVTRNSPLRKIKSATETVLDSDAYFVLEDACRGSHGSMYGKIDDALAATIDRLKRAGLATAEPQGRALLVKATDAGHKYVADVLKREGR